MATITTCLIVKNEIKTIRRCLESILPFSDEIIVYDTGSTDGTDKECIGFPKTSFIYGEWRNDFAWARNKSIEGAKGDFIMWVDGDDCLSKDSSEWIRNFKETELDKYDEVDIEYLYDMNEKDEYSLHFYRERIMRRSLNPKWVGRIHEYFEFPDIQLTSDMVYSVPLECASICHHKHASNPMRNLEIYDSMARDINYTMDARDWFYYARECMWHRSADESLTYYWEAINLNGWYVDRINAFVEMAGIYYGKGDYSMALECGYRAAACSNTPRADACNKIAYTYQKLGNEKMAEIWFNVARNSKAEGLERTFMSDDEEDLIPNMELCVIYFNRGDYARSKECNDAVLAKYPKYENALHNDELFKNL